MRLTRLLPVLLLVLTAAACAPTNTGSTVQTGSMGSVARIEYGTIVGMRPVQVQGQGGIGTLGGAVAGGIAGSYIGGDWRANALAGIGGALLGGMAGSAIDRAATSGTAVEFIVRTDRGGDIAVVQTNEAGLQVGERVAMSLGRRAHLMRAAGPAPQHPGMMHPGMAPNQGFSPMISPGSHGSVGPMKNG